MKILATTAVLLALMGAGALLFVYSGAYDIGADVPHTRLGFWIIETLVDRSIETHAADIQAPSLDNPAMIAKGAEHYAAMCTGCHLAPGLEDSEIRRGLYPQPPKLTEVSDLSPAQQFWIIKHGLKLSAMPAWGATHSDEEIWNLVAFLQKLPALSLQEYERMTAGAAEHHHGHDHEEHGR